MLVDWCDASRGDPVADVARTCLLLDSGSRHLPGSNGSTLGSLAGAYLERLWEPLGLDHDRLERWTGINAVARMAEGLASPALFAAWERLDDRAELVEDRRFRRDDQVAVLGAR
jgi:hypothetical protein